MIHTGDCLEVMAGMEPGSVDAIVTDPPYNLTTGRTLKLGPLKTAHAESSARRRAGGFMGKAWDGTGVAFRPETWEAALRVARPGSYLLAFGGTRTYHRLACAIEDAGWIIRDCLVWAYASGFPKSRALLKPAWEPIVMARKPGPLRMLDIDGCRIGFVSDADRDGAAALQQLRTKHPGGAPTYGGGKGMPPPTEVGVNAGGRWPSNVLLTSPIYHGDTEGVVGGGETGPAGTAIRHRGLQPSMFTSGGELPDMGYGDTGTYSRFFLIPKASRSDREPVFGGLETRPAGAMSGPETRPDRPSNHPLRRNHHPTVKPVDLMRHLVRLVTPPGGRVLDPFAGSGSTLIAAEMEGFGWIGIEREAEYVAIAEARLQGVQRGLGLDVPAPTPEWRDYPTATRYPVKGPSQSSWFTDSTRDADPAA